MLFIHSIILSFTDSHALLSTRLTSHCLDVTSFPSLRHLPPPLFSTVIFGSSPPLLLPRLLPLPPPLLPPPLHPISSRRPLHLSTRRHICVHGLKGVTNGQSCRIPLPLSTLPAKLPLLSHTWFRPPTLLHFHLS